MSTNSCNSMFAKAPDFTRSCSPSIMIMNPDYAARKFAEGARRRTMVLQVPDPAASRDKFGEIASPLWLKCRMFLLLKPVTI